MLLFKTLENYTNSDNLMVILNLNLFFANFFSILTILNKNPVVSVLFLISLYAVISFYLILLGLSFIGLSYLIVYIGAVAILFLFILMLINVRTSELQSNTNNSIPLILMIAITFDYLLSLVLPHSVNIGKNYNFKEILVRLGGFVEDNDYVTSNIWDSILIENSHITTIGNTMYTNYNL